MFRRIFCSIMAAGVLVALCGCTMGGGEPTSGSAADEGQQAGAEGEVLTTIEAVVTESTTAYAEVTEAVVTTQAPEIQTTQQTAVSQPTLGESEDVTEPTIAVTEDVSLWDKEKIVEFYKAAADKTGTAVKSEQTVGLQDISVNNGQLGGVFSFVTPILNSFFSSSKTVTDGITGEYAKLTSEDVSQARAYTCSSGTAIEITLNGQTDKGSGGAGDGSVSHGIYVVGDLLSVMSQLKDKGLPIDISLENTVINYSDAVIKAVIDADGKIINGSWTCTVEISLFDYKFAGSTVDSTVVVLDNKITVNGGFKS